MEFTCEVIKEIQRLTEEIKRQSCFIDNNEIIRDDVFNILQQIENCTVVYFPIESEASEDGCDGCHVVRNVKGHQKQLVYINTANTRERQAFSVAHELGHIWNVDGRLREVFPDVNIDVEAVINRFAAELLMPERLFNEQGRAKIKEFLNKEHAIKLLDMIKVVVYLMNYFFVPYKAVVLRLVETGIIQPGSENVLLKYKESEYVKGIILEEQYTRLGIKTRNRSIANLQENIDEIERRKLFSINKINRIREQFGLNVIVQDADMETTLQISRL